MAILVYYSVINVNGHSFWKIYISFLKCFLASSESLFRVLTHWGWATHTCIIKLTIIGSDNALSPGCYQAIIWTNDGRVLMWTNLSEILTSMYIFSFKKVHLIMSFGKLWPFCLGPNVLNAIFSMLLWCWARLLTTRLLLVHFLEIQTNCHLEFDIFVIVFFLNVYIVAYIYMVSLHIYVPHFLLSCASSENVIHFYKVPLCSFSHRRSRDTFL